MMASTTSMMRSTQNDPIISKPKGVYSIDQILGNQSRQTHNIGKYIMTTFSFAINKTTTIVEYIISN